MGRDAAKACENQCFRCRKEAAKHNDKLGSREGAAELLGISVSSLADYELGNTKVIPVDKVVLMADIYNAPELMAWYSKDDPAQMVVGKDAYLRRAFDHPDYLFKNDGITVQRGNEIIQKEGCCLYPGETLVGGWCRVTFMRNGKERTAFKEVAFAEYNKGQANWKSKPATMINKVAVSQCVRDAFPKDYEGVYSEDEMIASGAIPVGYRELDDPKPEEQPAEEEDPVISQEQRQQLFKAAQANFGKDKGNAVVKSIIEEMGLTSTTGMKMSTYNKVVERLVEICTAHKAELEAEEGTKNDGAAEE